MILYNIGKRDIETQEGTLSPQGHLKVSKDLGMKLIKMYPSELRDSKIEVAESSNKAVEALSKKLAQSEEQLNKANTKVADLKESEKTLKAEIEDLKSKNIQLDEKKKVLEEQLEELTKAS